MGVFVSINMCSSIDGKISSKDRPQTYMGSPHDRQCMGEVRKDKDAIVMGASTFQVHPYVLSPGKKHHAYRKRKKLSLEPATVLLSSSLKFPKGTKWERASYADRIVFCGKGSSKQRRTLLEKNGVRVFSALTIRPKASFVLQQLSKLGYRNILLEGGGELNASFLEVDLVDRIHLTIAPYILGGRSSPTICDGIGFPLSSPLKWKLQKCKKIGEELYLTYDRHGHSRKKIS